MASNQCHLAISSDKIDFLDLFTRKNSVITNMVVNEHSVITNRFLRHIGHFVTQINPDIKVVTNKNSRSQPVRYNQV